MLNSNILPPAVSAHAEVSVPRKYGGMRRRNGDAVPAGRVESARRLRGPRRGGCFNPLAQSIIIVDDLSSSLRSQCPWWSLLANAKCAGLRRANRRRRNAIHPRVTRDETPAGVGGCLRRREGLPPPWQRRAEAWRSVTRLFTAGCTIHSSVAQTACLHRVMHCCCIKVRASHRCMQHNRGRSKSSNDSWKPWEIKKKHDILSSNIYFLFKNLREGEISKSFSQTFRGEARNRERKFVKVYKIRKIATILRWKMGYQGNIDDAASREDYSCSREKYCAGFKRVREQHWRIFVNRDDRRL